MDWTYRNEIVAEAKTKSYWTSVPDCWYIDLGNEHATKSFNYEITTAHMALILILLLY